MPISVNEAIDRLEEFDGQNVEIFGVLSLDFEGTASPCSARRTAGSARRWRPPLWFEHLDQLTLPALEREIRACRRCEAHPYEPFHGDAGRSIKSPVHSCVPAEFWTRRLPDVGN